VRSAGALLLLSHVDALRRCPSVIHGTKPSLRSPLPSLRAQPLIPVRERARAQRDWEAGSPADAAARTRACALRAQSATPRSLRGCGPGRPGPKRATEGPRLALAEICQARSRSDPREGRRRDAPPGQQWNLTGAYVERRTPVSFARRLPGPQPTSPRGPCGAWGRAAAPEAPRPGGGDSLRCAAGAAWASAHERPRLCHCVCWGACVCDPVVLRVRGNTGFECVCVDSACFCTTAELSGCDTDLCGHRT